MSQQINLYNAELHGKRESFSTATMLQSLAVIAVCLLALYGYELYLIQQLKSKSDNLTALHANVQAKLAAYSADLSLVQAKQMLDDELKNAEVQLASQEKLLEMLKHDAVGNTSGYSEYMRAFSRQAIYGLWLTGFDISGDKVSMSIRGGLLNPELLPGFINRLKQEKAMRGKEFSSLQMLQHKADTEKPAGRSYLDFILVSAKAGDQE